MKYINRIRKTVKYKQTRSTVLEKPWNIQTVKYKSTRKTMQYTNRQDEPYKKNHGIYKPTR